MLAFEAILAMLLLAVVLGAVARRVSAPFPTLLAVGGAALALSPIGTPLKLDPSLALALFVAPILLDAGYDISPRDLKRNWRAIGGLVLVAVGLTAAAVAAIAHALVPAMPWAAAVALGAIVAPPDAAAATSVLKSAEPPHRVTIILEGESLLNDASALLLYRLAVGAAMAGGSLQTEVIAPTFLLSVVGSLVAGPLLALVWSRVISRIEDVPSSIIVQFVGTFGIWVLAERLELSPVLTVVAYAITTARLAPAHTAAQERVPSYAVWETAVVVLNALAFVLIGLQLGPVLHDAQPGEVARWAVVGGAVLATVIAMRMVWVMGANAVVRWRYGEHEATPVRPETQATWQSGLVIGWCGMRGVVTVATALALPADFPEHDLILFTAFFVTLGTLLIQGMTLRPLVLALGLGQDDAVDHEVRLARVSLADAALDCLESEGDRDEDARILRRELMEERAAADEAEEGDGRAALREKKLRSRTLEARRQKLLDLRSEGTIGDDAFHRLEEELDFADLALQSHL